MNKFVGYFSLGVAIVLGSMAFTSNNKVPAPVTDDLTKVIEIPEEVNTILQNHCFGCHNSESKNEKGRDKLSIDMLNDLPKAKLAAKLNKLAKEVEEGEMPPKKFLAKYPDKEPSKKDKKKVINWAKSAVKDL